MSEESRAVPHDAVAQRTKSVVLRDFQHAADRLRQAAQDANTHETAPSAWGPREVLAHITLWAIQAAEHFAHRLPPLDYGAEGQWGPEAVGTFNTVFETLAGPGMSPDRARQMGWDAVARAGLTLPLAVPEDDELHARADDAFNTAAVELVKDTPFEVVLAKTEQAHSRLYCILDEHPSTTFVRGDPTYERLLLIIAHHNEHTRELERPAGQTP